MSAERTLADVERYCRMMSRSMTVPAAEVADDVLAIIRGGRERGSFCGEVGHADGCGCHLKPVPPPPVTVWEEAASEGRAG